MSAFVKNVGALGVFMPVAIQAAERRNRPVSRYLMPLAFGSLIGGTITQIGTSPNILISQVRQEVVGQPYHLFDFTPVGLPLSCVAIVFLSIGWRLLPTNRRGQPSPEKRFAIEDYTSEATAARKSHRWSGKTVADLEALGEGEVTVAAIIREQSHRYVPRAHWTLYRQTTSWCCKAIRPRCSRWLIRRSSKLLGADEIAALKPRQGRCAGNDRGGRCAGLAADRPHAAGPASAAERTRSTCSRSAAAAGSTTTRLRHSRFEAGDIVVLQGRQTQLDRRTHRAAPAAARRAQPSIGTPRWRYVPLLILLAAMIADRDRCWCRWRSASSSPRR